MDARANLPKLLGTILNSFVDLCECDGGSIYTLRKDGMGNELLVFETMTTRSIKLQAVPEHLRNLSFRIDDETSLVSKTANRRELLRVNFEDRDAGNSPKVDHLLSYATRNMLSAPLITPRGDLVGVVQLVNKLPYRRGGEAGPKTPPTHANFDSRDERLLRIVAVQAALAIENCLLLEEQEKLLEGFVNACVTAIESRDPVTSGHSQRVADYTVALGEAVTRSPNGPLRETRFSDIQLREIRYAAMLHDVGKISVKEEVLNKQKKLPPWELEMVRMRLKLMRANLKLRQQLTQQDMRGRIERLDQAWQAIAAANEPAVLPTEVGEVIQELRAFQVETDDGEILSALTESEGFKLSIKRGSLTDAERVAIESHVSYSYEILKRVPWSRGLERVPEIAWKHHEKLDGSGYPCKCPAHDIPVQSRMLTICDIFDALTADDRPYKPALPLAKALDILGGEVKGAKLDADLFRVFLDARVYELDTRHGRRKPREAA